MKLPKLFSKPLDQEDRVAVIFWIVFVGFAAAVFFHYYMGTVLGKNYPWNTFLFKPDDRFMDFFNPVRGSANRDPFTLNGGYLPFGYFTAYLFSLIKLPEGWFRPLENPIQREILGPWLLACVIYLLGFCAYLFWYTWAHIRFLRQDRIAVKSVMLLIFPFLTYPILYAVDRANFDLLVFIFLSFFIYLYQKGEFAISGIFLAMAIAMKGYAGIFLVLLLADKKFKEIVYVGLWVGVLSVLSLALFQGGVVAQSQKFLASLGSAYDNGIANAGSLRFSSSLFSFLVVALSPLGFDVAKNTIFSTIYTIFIFGIAGLFLLEIFLERVFWRQVAILTILMILLPWSSGDYRLIFMFLQLYMFLIKSLRSIYYLV